MTESVDLRPHRGLVRGGGLVRPALRTDVTAMSLDIVLGLAASVGLAVYLFYVLARPERF